MGTKAVTLIELLAQMDVDPEDPRVIRILELSVKKREQTITEAEKQERHSILPALMEEAKRKRQVN